MNRKVGLWIDHRKAVIISLVGEEEEVKLIESNVEKHVRSSGGSRSKTPYGPEDVVAEDNRERRFTGHLNKYYDEVISSIHDAEAVLIFGPGEAKNELKKHIKSKELQGRIVRVETVDKMTDHQIAAKVRQYFLQ
jgi:stalled ribosome rescue protein Dom34